MNVKHYRAESPVAANYRVFNIFLSNIIIFQCCETVVFAVSIVYNKIKDGGVKDGCCEKGRDLYHR